MFYWRKLYAFLTSFILVSTGAAASDPQEQTLEFVENRGQWPAPVRYSADLPHGRLFLEAQGLTYSLLANMPHTHESQKQHESNSEIQAHSLRVAFEGSTPQPILRPAQQTTEVRHYLRGNDPKCWAHDVPGFRQVRYAEIWPGIGAHFYENQNQHLEYDFELTAGADPTAIRLRYDGAESLALAADGSLEARTSVGVVRELAPKAWQTDAAGQRRPVSCAYVLEGHTVHFQLGTYDRRLPLTIDPTVVFSSFTGSTANNLGYTATYDAQGNMYSGSIVFSAGYPVTTGAFRTTFASVTDIGLIKFNTSATGPAARAWATYLGGSQGDFPHSLVVSKQGELVLLGTTGSSDYPVSSAAYDRTFNGGKSINPMGFGNMPSGSDLVVTRLSADGSQLVGSTFLGGSGNDGLLIDDNATQLIRNCGDTYRGDVLLDANDNIYVASTTTSLDFPNLNGLGGTYRGGTSDAVVCKLSPAANNLLWSSYLGGAGADAAYSLQLDAASNLYVAGGTTSANFPATPGTLYPTARGGTDGFVARISNAGTRIEKATYLGTSAYDQVYFVQIDGSGDVYVLGQSLGSYPVTAGRYQNPNSKQFIHKLDADLSTTDFSTVFGSGRSTIDISPTAFLVDRCNRIYVSGWGGGINSGSPFNNGSTLNLPTTANAVQRTTDGQDFYLIQLAPDATSLEYASYFGQVGSLGDHVDGGTSRFDPQGIVYEAVCICYPGSASAGFPVPPGAGFYSSTSGNSGVCNNAAFKLNFETTTVTAGANQQVCLNAGTYPLYGSPGGGTWSGPGVSGSAATGFVFTPSAVGLGEYQLTYTVDGVGNCGGTSTTRLTVTPRLTATFNPLPESAFCLKSNTAAPSVALSATPAGGQFSGPGVTGSQFYPGVLISGTYTLIYTYSQNGCQAQATQQVTITRAEAGFSLSTCSASAPTRLTGSPAGGTWSGPGVSGSVAAGFVFTPTEALVGIQQLTYSINSPGGSCTATSTIQVTVGLSPPTNLPSFPEYCVTNTNTVLLPTTASWYGPGVYYSYTSPAGYYFRPSLAGVGTHTLSAYFSGNCSTSRSIQLTVRPIPAVLTQPDTALCPGSTQPIQLKADPVGGSWSGPGISSSGRFTPPAGFVGSITAIYTYNSGPCTATITRKISAAPLPTFAPAWKPIICAEDREAPLRVHFGGVAAGAVWDFGDGSQGVGGEVDHTYTTAGRYQPRVVLRFNNDKCIRQADLALVEVKPFRRPPDIITPNGDGLNDVFKASEACPRRLQIFSRWGNQVYESSAYQNDWDGGKQPAGVYYYLLYLADGTKYKGWLEVQR